MNLFNRKRKEEKMQPGKDRLASGIVRCILKLQTGFAMFMNRNTRKLSTSTLKYALIVFLFCGSGISIYFIVIAFTKKQTSKAVNIDRLRVPRYHNKNGDESAQSNFFITKREHEEMQSFKAYMDSLYKTKKGKAIYDSIMLHRPDLMDSVNRLEQLYQQQLQNKK